MTDQIFQKAQQNIEEVISTNGKTEIDERLINQVTDRLKIDASLLRPGSDTEMAIISKLLPPSIQVLKLSATTPIENLESIVELIEALLSKKTFEQVTQLISLADIIEGIESVNVPSLQKVAAKQASKASPPDIIANTSLIEALLRQLSNTQNKQPSAIESCLVQLATSGELIIRRLFTGNCLQILKDMHDSNDAILIGRLLELVKGILLSPKIAKYVYEEIAIRKEIIGMLKYPITAIWNPNNHETWDVFLIGIIVQSLRDIFGSDKCPTKLLIATAHSSESLTEQPSNADLSLFSELDKIANLFSMINFHSDIRYFLASDILSLFRALTTIDGNNSPFAKKGDKNHKAEDGTTNEERYALKVQIFKTLDEKYQLVKKACNPSNASDPATAASDTLQMLTHIGPKYLLTEHKDIIKRVEFNSKNIPVFCNLVHDEECCKYLELTQNQIVNGLVDYFDKILLVSHIIQTPYGLNLVLKSWPQVMNQIIIAPKNEVREANSFEVRREVLKNLTDLDPYTLGTWYGSVREAYREVIFGPGYYKAPSVAVASQSL